MEFKREGGTKVCINSPGHMSKMATTPIYGKTYFKIFFYRTVSPMNLKRGMQHQGLKAHKFCINGCPWVDIDLFYGKVKFGNFGFFIRKSENWGFSEIFAACGLKVRRCSQLIELIKGCEH